MPFRPIRHQYGATTFRTKNYPAVTSGVMYVGDPVRVSAGVVKPMGATASAACLGAVAYFLNPQGRPATFTLPNGNIGKPAGVTGWSAAIYDDPGIVYEVSADVTASAAMIGRSVRATAGTPSTAAGQSGYIIVASAATAADAPFKIIDVSPSDINRDGLHGTVEVIIVKHTLNQQLA